MDLSNLNLLLRSLRNGKYSTILLALVLPSSDFKNIVYRQNKQLLYLLIPFLKLKRYKNRSALQA